jgi:hypothetical protein
MAQKVVLAKELLNGLVFSMSDNAPEESRKHMDELLDSLSDKQWQIMINAGAMEQLNAIQARQSDTSAESRQSGAARVRAAIRRSNSSAAQDSTAGSMSQPDAADGQAQCNYRQLSNIDEVEEIVSQLLDGSDSEMGPTTYCPGYATLSGEPDQVFCAERVAVATDILNGAMEEQAKKRKRGLAKFNGQHPGPQAQGFSVRCPACKRIFDWPVQMELSDIMECNMCPYNGSGFKVDRFKYMPATANHNSSEASSSKRQRTQQPDLSGDTQDLDLDLDLDNEPQTETF